ncbi:MAG: TonB family protein [Candidatus Thiosymbion ectosymbiont of Robbea hypermnestra]|nr:TonB family protein [Candidatus Thiosymbion ectosymbiont of Robbea hypermnestra]
MPGAWESKATTDASVGLFAVALLIACLIHLILLLGVGLSFPGTGPDRQAARPLALRVLHRMEPSNALPAIADAEPDTKPKPAVREQSREQPADPVSPAPPEPQPPVPPSPASRPTRVDATRILASRDRALAELTARTRHDSATSANRPQRKAIRADTRDYKYANYLEAWRRKVERVGNLNYPEAAKRRKLYGSLVLRIALRADGSVERIRVLRSSGSDLLDQAAIGIVELAAPFSPFPPDIRAEAEILEITRTWRFLSNNRLGWER